MGFRRFEHFNQALLAKIGWRILQDPQSLLAQVYKGKYFPRGTFLQAQARSRPSWGWQSVLFGRQLLEQGLRWQIGNGASTSLLSSNWLPQLHPEKPVYNPQVLPEGGELMVAEVLDQDGEGGWCETKLRQWFDPPTCRIIRSIPLPRQNMVDKLIWHCTTDGVFTVKTAYHLVVDQAKKNGCWRATASWMDRVSWIWLWEADIPPKLKVFVWQIFHRILPTTEGLIEKSVPVLPRCPVCWDASETMEHLFLECPAARALWDYSGLEHLGQGLPRHTFPLFLKRLFALIHQPPMIMAVVVMLWRIWKSRNWVVFEGKQFGFSALMRQFHQQCEEWERVSAGRVEQGPRPILHPPGLAWGSSMVCMRDGATRAGSHSAGGMVLLDPHREVLRAQGVQFGAIDDPWVVEALVLREAILWCVANGFQEVRFEGDAKVIIEKINQAETRDSRIGMILEEIRHCMVHNSGFSVRFVGRRNNRVAHAVARKALALYPSTCRSFNFQAWLISRM
ncbi:unnamed protein product [Linum trigynum]|uniref:Reverse transcriptase zinc-binding domain-containing protein n=1 Tax=Linum trigynum TaxID=586398 RepID=A0AAV2FP20_9ROSI